MADGCPRCGHERPADSCWLTCSTCGLHIDDWPRYNRPTESARIDGPDA